MPRGIDGRRMGVIVDGDAVMSAGAAGVVEEEDGFDIVEGVGPFLEVVSGEGHPDLAHQHHADLHVIDGDQARQEAEAEAAAEEVILKAATFAEAAMQVIRTFEERVAAFKPGESTPDSLGQIENPRPDCIIFNTVMMYLNSALAQGNIDRARGFIRALIAYADPYGHDKPDADKSRPGGVHNSPRYSQVDLKQ